MALHDRTDCVIISHGRKFTIARRSLDPDVLRAISPSTAFGEGDILLREELTTVARLLREFRQREQDIVALKFDAELANGQIAEIMDLTEANVRVILFRTLRKLRELLPAPSNGPKPFLHSPRQPELNQKKSHTTDTLWFTVRGFGVVSAYRCVWRGRGGAEGGSSSRFLLVRQRPSWDSESSASGGRRWIAGVDVVDLAGDACGGVGAKVDGGVPYLVDSDVATQRRDLRKRECRP